METAQLAQSAPVAVPHDFPFRICVVCHCPILAADLAGTEFEPRHASTCMGDQQEVSR